MEQYIVKAKNIIAGRKLQSATKCGRRSERWKDRRNL